MDLLPRRGHAGPVAPEQPPGSRDARRRRRARRTGVPLRVVRGGVVRGGVVRQRPRRRLRPVTVGCPAALLAVVAALSLLAGARPAAAGSGSYGWPLAAPHPVLRGFEAPASQWGPGHRGADLGARGGSVVAAAGEGTVSFAAVLAGRGVVVVAHPDGLRTTYEPVTASVRVGAHLARGDPLGRLALAGSHCLPRACLHWGALRRSTYLDPLTLLGLAPGPVRLLPMGPGAETAPGPLPLAAWPPEVRPVGGSAARGSTGTTTLRTTSSGATTRAGTGGAARPAPGSATARAAPDGGATPLAALDGGPAPPGAGVVDALGATGLLGAASAAGASSVRRARRRAPPERS